MKNAEEAVGKVMAGLRSVEAAPGLEGRVADGVRRRMAERDALYGRFGVFGFRWGWLVGGFGCMAVLLMVMISAPRVQKRVVMRDAKVIDERAARSAAGAEKTNEQSVAGLSESVPQRLKPRSSHLGRGTVQVLLLGHTVSRVSSEGEKAKKVAVSFPAPPMPLTQQERLLLQVANHNSPEEVAILAHSELVSRDADETAIFEKFFGRPESVEQTRQRVNQGESR